MKFFNICSNRQLKCCRNNFGCCKYIVKYINSGGVTAIGPTGPTGPTGP